MLRAGRNYNMVKRIKHYNGGIILLNYIVWNSSYNVLVEYEGMIMMRDYNDFQLPVYTGEKL